MRTHLNLDWREVSRQPLGSTLKAVPRLWPFSAFWLARGMPRSNQSFQRYPTLGLDVTRQSGQSRADPAAEWVWAAQGGRRAEESVGIVGIEVPIILHTHTHTQAQTCARPRTLSVTLHKCSVNSAVNFNPAISTAHTHTHTHTGYSVHRRTHTHTHTHTRATVYTHTQTHTHTHTQTVGKHLVSEVRFKMKDFFLASFLSLTSNTEIKISKWVALTCLN